MGSRVVQQDGTGVVGGGARRLGSGWSRRRSGSRLEQDGWGKGGVVLSELALSADTPVKATNRMTSVREVERAKRDYV
ncbi:unnamed protein product [Arctogadus glacialis]